MISNRQGGFSLIELMVAVGITGILAGTSIPAYRTYHNDAAITVARINLKTGLNSFAIDKGYSPATGMLADLVAEGALQEIPNDPWTAKNKKITGAEEAADWFYENDGEFLTFYPFTHPDEGFKIPSFGLPPLQKGEVVAKATKPVQAGDQQQSAGQAQQQTQGGAGLPGLTPSDIANLTPEQVAMMPATDFDQLSTEQVAALTQAQLDERKVADKVRALDMTWLGGITGKTVKYLTPEQVAAIPDGGRLGQMSAHIGLMSKEQVQALPEIALKYGGQFLPPEQLTMLKPAQISSMTGQKSIENIAKMSSADFGKFSAAQKAALTQSQLDERKIAGDIRSLKQSKFKTVAANHIKYLTPKQISTIPHDWWFKQIPQASRDAMTQAQVQALNPTAFRNGAIGSLTASQRDWLTPDQIQNLTQDNFKHLSKNQFSQVTPKQIATIPHDWWFKQIPQATRDSMSKTQLQALKPTAFRNGAVGSLTASQRDWLTLDQIQNLTQDNFKHLNKNQFSQVTPKQIATIPHDWWFKQIPKTTRQSMTQEQVQALNPKAFNNGQSGSLTVGQRNWLTDKQIQNIDQSNFQHLSKQQFAKVTPAQIATIPHDWWFKKIPLATRQSMTKAQVQALHPNTLRNGQLKSLTATQQSWL